MFKNYTRLKYQQLKSKIPKGEIENALASRSSYRNFSRKPVTLDQLSELLYISAGLLKINTKDIDLSKRAYPSAGAKYPLEIYPLVLVDSSIKKGLYHYNVLENSLETLIHPLKSLDIKNIWMSQEYFKKASVIIIITSIFERTTKKYGNRGIGYSLIEAGHLGQNIYLMAQKLKIGCSAIGELREKEIIKLLDINPDEEQPVYYLALGN